MSRLAENPYLCTHNCTQNINPIDMTDILSLSPLEYILIGIAAVGIFLFFRACWQNIRRSKEV